MIVKREKSEAASSREARRGSVRFFDPISDDGFIAIDGVPGDLYFRGADAREREGLVPGRSVEFVIVPAPLGPRAERVEVID